MQINCDQCLFCQKTKVDGSFAIILRKALYSKFSQSQNYYYEKHINDILEDVHTIPSIKYKDVAMLVEPTEYMKRIYLDYESEDRIPILLEYYKYHINIPRMFHCKSINKRNEKTRQIIYRKIKIELGINEEQKPAPPTRSRKDTSEDCSVAHMKNLLKDLKIESTQPDLSRVTNSTILKDLVQLIGDQHANPNPHKKIKPFQLIHSSRAPSPKPIETNKLVYLNLHSSLLKNIEQKIKLQHANMFKIPLTQRQPQTAQHSRQNSATKNLKMPQKIASTERIEKKVIKSIVTNAPTKQTKPIKSRQSSIGTVGTVDHTTSKSNLTSKYSENLAQLAKQILMQKKQIKSKITTNNFFVQGSSNKKCIGPRNLYLEDLKNSMRSLRSRVQTPSKIVSNATSPTHRKK